jgi:hypothetical protein
MLKTVRSQIFLEYIEIIFFVIIIGVIAYVATLYSGIIKPALHSASVNAMTTNTIGVGFSVIDNTLFIICILILFIDLIVAYFHPKIVMGVVNLVFLLIFGYIASIFLATVQTFNSILAFNAILPNSYAFITSNYFIVIIFIFLILDTILNFRPQVISKREN